MKNLLRNEKEDEKGTELRKVCSVSKGKDDRVISKSNHVSQAARSGLSFQLTAALSMADRTLESADQLTRLNINLARATLAQSNIAVRQLSAAEDPQEFFSLWSAQLQPNARRLFDYGYYLGKILAAAQVELMKLASHSTARRRTIRIEGGQSSDRHIDVAVDRPAHAAKQAGGDAGNE